MQPANHTPLHVAMGEGCTDVVRLLLRHGADPEARDCQGTTPIWRGVLKSHVDAVHLLAAYGADIHSVSSVGSGNMNAWTVRRSMVLQDQHDEPNFVLLESWYAVARTWSPLRIAVAGKTQSHITTTSRFLFQNGTQFGFEMCLAIGSQDLRCRGSQPKHV